MNNKKVGFKEVWRALKQIPKTITIIRKVDKKGFTLIVMLSMIAGAFPVITLVLSQELINSIVKKSLPLRYTIILFTIYIIVSFLGSILSKYERDVTLIKVDILKKIATYFNVTTDYLLGVSDVKRDLQRQMKMNETLDEYYDLIEIYKDLDSYDKEMIWSIMQTVKKVGEKRKKDNKLIEES